MCHISGLFTLEFGVKGNYRLVEKSKIKIIIIFYFLKTFTVITFIFVGTL